MITANTFDEQIRIAAVRRLKLLDTEPEERFDRITRRAVEKLHVPISTITIMDEKREWFKSCQGMPQREGDRTIAFCDYALHAQDVFIIEDTLLDERFATNPYVVGSPHIRFYAGVALYEAHSRMPVGVFCIKDTKPRHLSMPEIDIFLELAKEASHEINKGA